jgi:TPR repeat protein
MYMYGISIDQDRTKGLEYFKKGFEKKNLNTYFYYGSHLIEESKIEEGEKMLEEGISLGSALCAHALGIYLLILGEFYLYGTSSKNSIKFNKNVKKAEEYFQTSLKLGLYCPYSSIANL